MGHSGTLAQARACWLVGLPEEDWRTRQAVAADVGSGADQNLGRGVGVGGAGEGPAAEVETLARADGSVPSDGRGELFPVYVRPNDGVKVADARQRDPEAA